jgi:hypothetical protein
MDNRSSKPAELSINDPSVEGWKLVPVEPTEEMLDAAYKHYESGDYTGYGSAYVAMLSAAPNPPSAPVQQSVDSWPVITGDGFKQGGFEYLLIDGKKYDARSVAAALSTSPSVGLNTKKGLEI